MVLEYDHMKFTNTFYARKSRPHRNFWFKPLLSDAIATWINYCHTAYNAIMNAYRPFTFNPDDDLLTIYKNGQASNGICINRI